MITTAAEEGNARIRPRTFSRRSAAPAHQRIDDREEAKLVEVRVGRADFRDPMLAHQHDGVQVMHQVATKAWMACGELRKDIQMPIRWTEYTDIGAAHERRNPILRLKERQ